MRVPQDWLERLRWRSIGPPRGGRCVAVAGDPADRAVFYFGACAGGVWKSDDGGTYWRNISDGFFRTAAVGAIAVAPSDPQVVYAGTGEACVRNDVSHGDGVYRSNDGGRTWRHLGLAATRHIARVRIDPRDPDRVYVAALGDIFGPGPERGVFRSRDGGRSFERVLFRSERAGAADLWLDPSNPRVLYAALWDAERKPWEMRSGGPASGLFRSTDGGESWSELTRKPGLPAKALLGRIGVCASPARGARVFAVIEAGDGESGLYKSDDGGERWERVSEERALLGRPWYYSHIVPDPLDPERLYSLNVDFRRSIDGGRTFQVIPTPHGDNHDLWIDPRDPRRMIEGNDGGACVSYNAGESFSTITNQPTGAFYHLDIDRRFPYRVCGTQQDNTAVSVPSRSRRGMIAWSDCRSVGSSESGHIAVDPRDPDLVFSGAVGSAPGGGAPIWRHDQRSEQAQLVTIWPEYWTGEDSDRQRHRFAWTFPLLFSPHDPDVLYAAGERVFRSRDRGQGWEAISPDLTRCDPEKLKASGGPITKDTSGAEVYCTVFALAESPLAPGLLWAGTDDGRVHVTHDAGASWKEVTPAGLGEWTTVATIEPSPHDPAVAYLAAHRYRLQDRAPYLFRTGDHGASWERIDLGLPRDEFVRVIRADPVRAGLLYVGSESGLHVSLDDGASWERSCGRLPVVPVYDLRIEGSELIAATHGRGFWILDDVTPLRELTREALEQPFVLFTPPPVHRYPTLPGTRRPEPGKTYLGGAAMEVVIEPGRGKRHAFLDAGHNPEDGVSVWFHLREARPQGDLSLRFLAADGSPVVTFWGRPASGEPEQGAGAPPGDPERPPDPRDWEIVPGERGLARFPWDLRCPGPWRARTEKGERRRDTGYLVPPGRYRVTLRVGEREQSAEFEVRKDPRVPASQADLEAQYALLLALREKLGAVNGAIDRVRKLRAQLVPWSRRDDAPEDLRASAKALLETLAEIESALTQPRATFPLTDRLKLPAGLDVKLDSVAAAVSTADAAPTRQALEVFAKHRAEADEVLARLDSLIAGGLRDLDRRVRALALPVVDASLPEDSAGA